jgi:hypothetical protein
MLTPRLPGRSGVRSAAPVAKSDVRSGKQVAKSDVRNGKQVAKSDVESGTEIPRRPIKVVPRSRGKSLILGGKEIRCYELRGAHPAAW